MGTTTETFTTTNTTQTTGSTDDSFDFNPGYVVIVVIITFFFCCMNKENNNRGRRNCQCSCDRMSEACRCSQCRAVLRSCSGICISKCSAICERSRDNNTVNSDVETAPPPPVTALPPVTTSPPVTISRQLSETVVPRPHNTNLPVNELPPPSYDSIVSNPSQPPPSYEEVMR
jgi:hypothetical protein